jgi:hypothetical protein
VNRDVVVGTEWLEVQKMFIDDFGKGGIIPRGIQLFLTGDVFRPTTSFTVKIKALDSLMERAGFNGFDWPWASLRGTGYRVFL